MEFAVNWPLFAVFVLVTLAAAATGAIFRPGSWYAALRKPRWTPPNVLFPIAWCVLYATIAVSAYLFTVAAAPGERALPLAAWGLQLALNALWSPLFFKLHRMDWALADIVLLVLAILATIVLFAPVSAVAAALLVPYLVWVSFASALNYTILILNRGRPVPDRTGGASAPRPTVE